MKALLSRYRLLFPVLCLLLTLPAHASNSIEDLPQLSTLLIHHFECRLALFLAPDDFKELNFELSTKFSGHGGPEKTLALKGDQVSAVVNSQNLQIRWTRNGKLVASNLASIQNTPSLARVLITMDPENEENRVDLGCTAVTFGDLRRNRK